MKHKKLQWLNGTVHMHDMFCQCDEPLKHLMFEILEKEKDIKFTEEEQQQLQKCLSTGDRGAPDGDVLGDGDLDRLFAEDVFGEEENDTR